MRPVLAHQLQRFSVIASSTTPALVIAALEDKLPPRTSRIVPIITYHVNATGVNRNTQRIATSPANMPTSAPRALAPRSSVPSKNRPSKLPKERRDRQSRLQQWSPLHEPETHQHQSPNQASSGAKEQETSADPRNARAAAKNPRCSRPPGN